MWSACYRPTCEMKGLCLRNKKIIGRGDTVITAELDEDGYCEHYVSPMQGQCINCKEFPRVRTLEGAKEFMVSGLCEPCFDRITGVEK